tara:strand:+ start:244 stop:1095 length:852 start_codon:yes stop_codon:yes gene_type:complete
MNSYNMAGSSSSVVRLVPAGQEPSEEEKDADLAMFLQEVHKLIETEPEKMTGKQHIDRLFRPGAKYFNMNPFEVLGLHWDSSPEDVKKAYRRMSVQVHPDKNPDNPLADPAFQIVKAAHDRLSDEERLAFCQRICKAASDAVERKRQSAKKKLRKEGAETGSIDDTVPEDDPAKFGLAVKIMISRMFAEFEQRKKQLEAKDKEMKKAAQEEQAEKEFMEALKKKEEKLWEKTRQKRVNSWRAWSQGGGGPKHKMPKVKAEEGDRGGYNAHNNDRGEEYKKDWR